MNQHHPFLQKCIVALTIPIVFAATCIGFGVRHSHEGGNLHHGHSHSHGHTHTHASCRGHFHSHSHHGHKHSHRRGDDSHNDAHIHVCVLGFNLTLPCSSGDIDRPRPTARKTNPSDVRTDSSSSEEFMVDLRPNVSTDGLFQFLTFVESVVPDRIQTPHDADEESSIIDHRVNDGRCRDLPQTPPPEWV